MEGQHDVARLWTNFLSEQSISTLLFAVDYGYDRSIMDIIQNPPGKWIVRNYSLRKFWAGERWSGILYEAQAFETREQAEDYLQANRETIENS